MSILDRTFARREPPPPPTPPWLRKRAGAHNPEWADRCPTTAQLWCYVLDEIEKLREVGR